MVFCSAKELQSFDFQATINHNKQPPIEATDKPLINTNLVDVSDIFIFFLLGEGEGGVRGARRRRDWFLMENPRRGGGSRRGRGRGAGRMSAANWRLGGGG